MDEDLQQSNLRVELAKLTEWTKHVTAQLENDARCIVAVKADIKRVEISLGKLQVKAAVMGAVFGLAGSVVVVVVVKLLLGNLN